MSSKHEISAVDAKTIDVASQLALDHFACLYSLPPVRVKINLMYTIIAKTVEKFRHHASNSLQ